MVPVHRQINFKPSAFRKTGNQESVLEESQEFWHKAATQDYEDVTNAIGEEVSSSIAGATKVLWQKLLLEDILKEKMSNAVTPANCSYLIPKRINTEVWSTIPSTLELLILTGRRYSECMQPQ